MPYYGYKPLHNIEEKVNHIIERLNLPTTGSVAQAIDGRQNFYIQQSHFRDTKVMFKARIADHRVLKVWGKNFSNERRFLRALTQSDFKTSLQHHIPTYINSQSSSCEWLMCQYIDLPPVGSSNISYDHPSRPELDKIIALLLALQKFPIKNFMAHHRWTAHMRQMDFYHYHYIFHQMIRRNKKAVLSVIPQSFINEAGEIILQSKKLLDKSAVLLSHGDFHPANIIVDGHALAIDWEEIHLDNVAADLFDLWVRMVDHPTLRRYLLTEFAKVTQQKEIFPELFRLNILARMPEEIALIWVPLLQKHENNHLMHAKIKKIINLCYSNYEAAIQNKELHEYS